ncbi:MAG: hypothetical protein JXR19_09840 [Bacteroidia bacterium]
MKVILTSCLLLYSFAGFSQVSSSGFQVQPLEKGETAVMGQILRGDSIIGQHAFLSHDSTAYQLMIYDRNFVIKKEIQLDNLDPHRKLLHFGYTESMSAFVLDSNSVYIYGAEMGYGSFPFALRTINGGESWEPIIFTTDSARISNMNYRMAQNSLILFNKDHGVLMQAQMNKKEKLEILILETLDGWATYRERKVKLGQLNRHELSHLHYKYFIDGAIEIHFDRTKDDTFYQSIDKAKSFKHIVVESAEN